MHEVRETAICAGIRLRISYRKIQAVPYQREVARSTMPMGWPQVLGESSRLWQKTESAVHRSLHTCVATLPKREICNTPSNRKGRSPVSNS